MGKKHHYIPAMHLAMFSDDPATSNHSKKLGRAVFNNYAYEEEGIVKFDHSSVAISNLGAVNKLYEDYGVDTESLLSTMEGTARHILVKVQDSVANNSIRRVILTRQEYIDLGHYLLILRMRHRLHLHQSITDLVDMMMKKSLNDISPEDFGTIVRKMVNRDIEVPVPVSAIMVSRNPTPLCLSVPFQIASRQTSYPITPFIDINVHVEYPPKYSDKMFIPVYREALSEHDQSTIQFRQSFSEAETKRIEFVYPLDMESEMKLRLFDALEGMRAYPEDARSRLDVNHKRGTYVPAISTGADAARFKWAVESLEEKDHERVVANKILLNPGSDYSMFLRSDFLQQQSYMLDTD